MSLNIYFIWISLMSFIDSQSIPIESVPCDKIDLGYFTFENMTIQRQEELVRE